MNKSWVDKNLIGVPAEEVSSPKPAASLASITGGLRKMAKSSKRSIAMPSSATKTAVSLRRFMRK